jgi:hypothetical protein
MSKNINVNPDHYKVRGRGRPGEDILHERNKATRSQQVRSIRAYANRKKKDRRGATK